MASGLGGPGLLPGEPLLPLPIPPDFIICDPIYSQGLHPQDCLLAANGRLPLGDSEVQFFTSPGVDSPGLYHLPFRSTHGGCVVTVQTAGPFRGRQPRYRAIPRQLRTLVATVIQQCVTLRGVGGFGTHGFANMARRAGIGRSFLTNQADDWPLDAVFLTIDVKKVGSWDFKPGNTDPEVPRALAMAAANQRNYDPRFNKLNPSLLWMSRSQSMQRGGDTTWYYQSPTVLSEMTYDCNADLGSPSMDDCAQIEWKQLGSTNPPSDTLAVGPGIPTILHSNTCYLAISATVSSVLTWTQIRTAVSTLMNVCIRVPNQAAQGGRASYANPQQISRRETRERQGPALTGLNALPPHVNITIFEQHQPWTNAAAELKSCTWDAVSKGKPVSRCPKI